MNDRLIRAAIALYPRDWRRRYGGELEQLVADAFAAGSSGRFGKAWLIIEVAASGVRERLRDRGVGRKHRIAGALATTAVATVAVFAVMGSRQITAKPSPPSPWRLAPGVHLGPGVKEISDTALHGTLGLQHTLLRTNLATGTVDFEVEGLPVDIKLDPKTDQILSVKLSNAVTPGSPRRRQHIR